MPRGRTLAIIALIVLGSGCGPTTPVPSPTPPPRVRLTVATVPAAQPHLERWIARYEELHPEVELIGVPVSGARAQEALARGTVDLALLDQEPAPFYQGVVTATLVTYEPIAVVVHPGNRLQDLSAAAIAELFSGRVADWSQVGGDAEQVQIYLPSDSTGEVRAFAAMALSDRQLAPQAVIRASAASVRRAVSTDPGGVGLLPASEATGDVTVLRVDGAFPSDEGYPWYMPLWLAHGPASPTHGQEFIRFATDLYR